MEHNQNKNDLSKFSLTKTSHPIQWTIPNNILLPSTPQILQNPPNFQNPLFSFPNLPNPLSPIPSQSHLQSPSPHPFSPRTSFLPKIPNFPLSSFLSQNPIKSLNLNVFQTVILHINSWLSPWAKVKVRI